MVQGEKSDKIWECPVILQITNKNRKILEIRVQIDLKYVKREKMILFLKAENVFFL